MKVSWDRHFFFEDDILQTEKYSPNKKKSMLKISIAMAERGFENPAFDPNGTNKGMLITREKIE